MNIVQVAAIGYLVFLRPLAHGKSHPNCKPPGSGNTQVLERWKPPANPLLSSTHNALQSADVPGGGASEPHIISLTD